MGDTRLNAWGGVQTTTAVVNPGGSVFIKTHSPMEILQGITAGQDIGLQTFGSSNNNMFLDGTFTYGPNGQFVVNVGDGGFLVLGSSFSGVITLQIGGFNPLANTTVAQSYSSTVDGTNTATEFNWFTEQPSSGTGNGEDEDKDKNKGKRPNVCR